MRHARRKGANSLCLDGKYERLPQCNPNPLRKPTVKIDIFWQLLVAMVLVGAMAGCGDTWSGMKKDTGDNMEATGEAIEKTGEKVKSE